MLNDNSIWWEAIYKENEEVKTEMYYDEVVFYERVTYIADNIDASVQIVSGSVPF